MWLHAIWFAAGLVALVAGANALVHGASRLALSFGLSPLVVGLTVVAFGTSAPEMAVSAGAVLGGQTDIAVGNVVGSNIFNVLFILGASALITPLVVNLQLIRQEVPIMLGAGLLMLSMGLDGSYTLWEGALLLGLLVTYTAFLVVQSRRQTREAANDYDAELQPAASGAWDSKWPVQVVLIGLGLGLLVLGADWLVSSATVFAKAMGVSDLVIGLTIVAMGTSLPEVAASLTAAFKGERDMAVGNVVGSCTFNTLGCLGLSAMLAGTDGVPLSPALLNLDIWVMLAAFLACLPVFLSGREIARWEGGVFLAYYVAYVTYMIMASRHHDALPAFSGVMLSFVVPLTIVAMVATLMRHKPA
jgi:cation:H+ antiporter